MADRDMNMIIPLGKRQVEMLDGTLQTLYCSMRPVGQEDHFKLRGFEPIKQVGYDLELVLKDGTQHKAWYKVKA